MRILLTLAFFIKVLFIAPLYSNQEYAGFPLFIEEMEKHGMTWGKLKPYGLKEGENDRDKVYSQLSQIFSPAYFEVKKEIIKRVDIIPILKSEIAACLVEIGREDLDDDDRLAFKLALDELNEDLSKNLTLDLSFESIRIIPIEILLLQDLKHLDIRHNKLIEFPTVLYDLPSLETVQSEGNPFTPTAEEGRFLTEKSPRIN